MAYVLLRALAPSADLGLGPWNIAAFLEMGWTILDFGAASRGLARLTNLDQTEISLATSETGDSHVDGLGSLANGRQCAHASPS
jgi:hypothetical protein